MENTGIFIRHFRDVTFLFLTAGKKASEGDSKAILHGLVTSVPFCDGECEQVIFLKPLPHHHLQVAPCSPLGLKAAEL